MALKFPFHFPDVDSGRRLICFSCFTHLFRYQEERNLVVGGFELLSENSAALVSSPRSGPGLGFSCRRVDSFAEGISAILPLIR